MLPREWALKAERGQLAAPPEEPKKSWRELLQQIRENQRQKDLLDKWEPRRIQVGKDVPVTGAPEMYEEKSPERRLAEYLHFWMRRNYGYMATCVPLDMGAPANAMPGIIRERFDGRQLHSFTFYDITDIAASVTEIETKLVTQHDGRETEHLVKFRLIHQNVEGRSVIRGEPNGEWVVYNWGNI